MPLKPAVTTMATGLLAALVGAGCTPTAESRAQGDCNTRYADEGSYAKGRWEYFVGDVNALLNNADAGTLISIGLHSRVFLLPADADPSFMRHAGDSLKNRTPVHVAVETLGNPQSKQSSVEPTGHEEKGEWIIRWLHPVDQHPSCR